MEVITIGPAIRADIPFLAECRFGMFQEMHPETDFRDSKDRFLEESGAYFQDRFGNPDLFCVCARTSAEPVGCGVIMFQKRPPHIRDFANLFVVHDFRRRGVGTQLMAALKEEAGRRGVRRIGLNASEEGVCLYRKLGYERKENYMELKW